MPLLNEDSAINSELSEGWFAVRRLVKDTFGKRPDINAILFLIGMNELGQIRDNWGKEEKQDLMHIAICKLFEGEGYYAFTHEDEEGWPHYEIIKPLPNIHLKEQEAWLKAKIVSYFKENGYI
ncbi:MAG: hypothetical protein H6579_11155 [Chitinophagales bacterium]|nr:hypothetical protein [Chitinophagales bacterium]